MVIRGRLLRLCQDLRDDLQLFDAGEDRKRLVAAGAGLDIDPEDALQLHPRWRHQRGKPLQSGQQPQIA